MRQEFDFWLDDWRDSDDRVVHSMVKLVINYGKNEMNGFLREIYHISNRSDFVISWEENSKEREAERVSEIC